MPIRTMNTSCTITHLQIYNQIYVHTQKKKKNKMHTIEKERERKEATNAEKIQTNTAHRFEHTQKKHKGRR